MPVVCSHAAPDSHGVAHRRRPQAHAGRVQPRRARQPVRVHVLRPQPQVGAAFGRPDHHQPLAVRLDEGDDHGGEGIADRDQPPRIDALAGEIVGQPAPEAIVAHRTDKGHRQVLARQAQSRQPHGHVGRRSAAVQARLGPRQVHRARRPIRQPDDHIHVGVAEDDYTRSHPTSFADQRRKTKDEGRRTKTLCLTWFFVLRHPSTVIRPSSWS
jgi:hypothetical protein